MNTQVGEVAVVDPVIEVRGLRTVFGRQVVHDDVNLTVRRGEVIGVIGGSGAAPRHPLTRGPRSWSCSCFCSWA